MYKIMAKRAENKTFAAVSVDVLHLLPAHVAKLALDQCPLHHVRHGILYNNSTR
jgi:hypothetical protein